MLKAVLKLFIALALLSLTLVISFFNIFDDTLFFYSDLFNVIRFCLLLSLAVALVVLVLTIPFLKFSAERIVTTASLLCASFIAGEFLFFLSERLAGHWNVLNVLQKHQLDFLPFALWSLICIGITIALFKSKEKAVYAQRVHRVGAVILTCLLIVSLLPFFQPAPGHSEPRHVVLLVFDGMPSQYLHAFNTSVSPQEIDAVLSRGIVFRNMRTSKPWTQGYFSRLYRGTHDPRLAPDWNLFGSLQKTHVKTRWIVWHNAGVPETSRVSEYKGFRTILLNHRFSPLFQGMGLDYNMLICSRATKGLRSSRRNPAYQILNQEHKFENILVEMLLPEIQDLQKRNDRTFLLFHNGFSLMNASSLSAWEHDTLSKDSKNEMAKQIVSRNYQYTAAEKRFAETLNRVYSRAIDVTQRKLATFLEECERKGLMKDTLFILTADHGTMADKGRIWYGFHPHEEVLRVPTVLFYNNRSGVDDRNFDTADLVRTIVDFFDGVPLPPSRSDSLLGKRDTKFTASITLPSSVNREWFVAVYRSNKKYLFNLHPKGSASAQRFKLQDGSFEVQLEAEGKSVLNESTPFLRWALRELRVSPSAVHPIYQELMRPSEIAAVRK